jgi:RNA polymerase sigma-70 factor (ECF subfamily)
MSSESQTPQEAGNVEKWIAQAREGCPEALGRLLDTCRRYLLLVANQELASAFWAKVAPSDIVQDTLLKAGRDFPSFRGATEEELLGWLRRILCNNMANIHRHFETEKRGVDREVPLEATADVLRHDALHETETPSVLAQAREQDEQLQRALRELPNHYRQVLLLHSSEDLTFVQIAEKLESTPDAIRKLWGRAVEELAKLLESPHESA